MITPDQARFQSQNSMATMTLADVYATIDHASRNNLTHIYACIPDVDAQTLISDGWNVTPTTYQIPQAFSELADNEYRISWENDLEPT